jgi:hypothetical protein
VRVVKSRRMRWAGHVARMGEDMCVHRVLVGKPEGKRPLGRPKRRWEDNIKMNIHEGTLPLVGVMHVIYTSKGMSKTSGVRVIH